MGLWHGSEQENNHNKVCSRLPAALTAIQMLRCCPLLLYLLRVMLLSVDGNHAIQIVCHIRSFQKLVLLPLQLIVFGNTGLPSPKSH